MMNKKALFIKLKQPIVIIGILVSLLWAVNDFSGRIIKSIPDGTQINEISLEQATFKSNINAQQAARLIDLYKIYQPIVESEADITKPIGLTKEQQLRQSGLLTQVFIDNNKLTLKAIIQPTKGNKKVALIDVMDIAEQQHQLKRFDDETQVYGYTLEVLNNTQVKLTAQHDEQQTQEIILSMFKDIAPAIKSQ